MSEPDNEMQKTSKSLKEGKMSISPKFILPSVRENRENERWGLSAERRESK